MFVEDPGAANYIQQLPEALSARGIRSKLLTRGLAADYLRQFKVESEEVPPEFGAFAILKKHTPRVVMVGTAENPKTMGLDLIDSARGSGIVSVGIVDAGINSEYRFRGATGKALNFAPDWLLVPDSWTAERFEQLGYNRDKLVVCGHPHYDYVRSVSRELGKEDRNELRKKLFPGWSNGRQIWLFACEISTGCDPEQFRYSSEYTLKGTGRHTERTKVVLEEFLDSLSELEDRPYLVLRLHPKNTIEEFSDFTDRFDHVSKGGNVLEVIFGCDLVVGMTSMLLMEAALMDIATLSIVPRALEKQWLASTRDGITPCISTRDELKTVVKSYGIPGVLPVRAASVDSIMEGSMDRVLGFLARVLAEQN